MSSGLLDASRLLDLVIRNNRKKVIHRPIEKSVKELETERQSTLKQPPST